METRSIGWCCGALLWAVSATAAEPSLPTSFLVKDINTTPVIYSGNPRQFAVVGSRLYFVAETPRGSGLWVTDGTAAGTVPLRTMPIVGSLTGVGERLFFVGEEPDSGAELWTSDGTSAGTVLVRDIRPGPDYAFSSDEALNYLAGVGDVLFFSADDGEHGPQLWRSDGTADGTSSVAAVGAGEMIAAGAVLLFVGHDAQHGAEVWRSDGTAEGTQLVRDVNDGPAGSEILELTALGATIFFRADDGVHGAELWTSDATAPGTRLVKDITPGDSSSFPSQLVAVGGQLFFQAGDGSDPGHIWRSDGSAAGTVPVYATGQSFGRRVVLGGRLLFERQDDMHGSELWASDGTADRTALVKDINPGLANSYPAFLTTVNDLAFFTADDGIHGAELWRTDGTAAGTMLVRDINPGAAASASTYSDVLADLNGLLIFAADDGSHGLELWASDGTSAGTVLLKDTWPGPATQSASPKSLTALDGLLYFTADEHEGLSRLWGTDGTEAGTQRIGDVFNINPRMPHERDEPLAVLDRRLVFAASGGQPGNELWSSDGTSAGTAMLKDIWPGPNQSEPRDLTRIGDAIFFSADDGAHGRELWRTDGTGAGTVLVRDIFPGPLASSPSQLTAVGTRLFFVVGMQSSTQLWVSDGTAEGTAPLQDVFWCSNLTAVGDMLYFTAGTSVWRSDGTVEGTVRQADFHPVSGEYQPNQLTVVGEDLFFAAEPFTTVFLIVIGPQHSGQLRELNKFAPSGLTAAAGQLFFETEDEEHGRELWRSDGTIEGTRLVRDINPGAAGSDPVPLSADGPRLLFYACDDESCLLWETDGSESGTHPLAQLDPPGFPLVVSGGLAYFPGYDLTVGSELRAVALTPPQCLGDCDGDRAVTIVELVRMVGIALGKLDADTCSSASVSIDQLVTAVRNALLGC